MQTVINHRIHAQGANSAAATAVEGRGAVRVQAERLAQQRVHQPPGGRGLPRRVRLALRAHGRALGVARQLAGLRRAGLP